MRGHEESLARACANFANLVTRQSGRGQNYNPTVPVNVAPEASFSKEL